MQKYLKILLFLLLPITLVQGQEYKIQFSYDAAGNQIKRDRVCVNCPALKAIIDSTLIAELKNVKELEEIISETENPIITAYPNPVTDILQVEWVKTDNDVQSIILFSGIGQILLDKNIDSTYSSFNIDFNTYPSGKYIVNVIYADNTRQSFQVLKK